MFVLVTCIAVVFFILLCVSLYVNYMYIKGFDELEKKYNDLSDVIDSSLEELKQNKQTIMTIAGFEVVSDEPFVRRVVEAVTDCQFAVNRVALRIRSVYGEEEVEADDEDI